MASVCAPRAVKVYQHEWPSAIGDISDRGAEQGTALIFREACGDAWILSFAECIRDNARALGIPVTPVDGHGEGPTRISHRTPPLR
jgi:hypothetical protein